MKDKAEWEYKSTIEHSWKLELHKTCIKRMRKASSPISVQQHLTWKSSILMQALVDKLAMPGVRRYQSTVITRNFLSLLLKAQINISINLQETKIIYTIIHWPMRIQLAKATALETYFFSKFFGFFIVET